MIFFYRSPAVFEWFGIRLEKNAGEALDDIFRFLRTEWCFSNLAHVSSSYQSSSFNVDEIVCLFEL
jgi:hypothetical protein